jgi:anti-anti-sigma factor
VLDIPAPTPVMRTPFSCRRLDAGGAVRLAVSGELDITATPRFEAELAEAQAGRPVVLDLRDLRFLDCGGIRVLLAADRRARRAGGRFVVVRGPVDVERILALVGVELDAEFVDRPPRDLSPVIE